MSGCPRPVPQDIPGAQKTQVHGGWLTRAHVSNNKAICFKYSEKAVKVNTRIATLYLQELGVPVKEDM